MALVELRPGDTLNIVWSSVQDTPFGVQEVESSFAFDYEDLVVRLRSHAKIAKSRRSGSEGARFSRVVALASSALKKGRWSTGAEISRSEVFKKMTQRFQMLDSGEYANITEHAKKALTGLHKSENILSSQQKTVLKEILLSLGLLH